jgi:hypothetical protein
MNKYIPNIAPPLGAIPLVGSADVTRDDAPRLVDEADTCGNSLAPTGGFKAAPEGLQAGPMGSGAGGGDFPGNEVITSGRERVADHFVGWGGNVVCLARVVGAGDGGGGLHCKCWC